MNGWSLEPKMDERYLGSSKWNKFENIGSTKNLEVKSGNKIEFQIVE